MCWNSQSRDIDTHWWTVTLRNVVYVLWTIGRCRSRLTKKSAEREKQTDRQVWRWWTCYCWWWWWWWWCLTQFVCGYGRCDGDNLWRRSSLFSVPDVWLLQQWRWRHGRSSRGAEEKNFIESVVVNPAKCSRFAYCTNAICGRKWTTVTGIRVSPILMYIYFKKLLIN